MAEQLQAAVIGDVVGSRDHADQSDLLSILEAALAWTNARVEPAQPLELTIGDEFQGAYPSLTTAIEATLLLRLRLPRDVDVRFGIGWGEITTLDPDRAPRGQSGSAWWSARAAIERVAAAAGKQRWPRSIRSWVDGASPHLAGALNAHLLCRDHLLAGMDGKDLRIALGLFLGERQDDVASELGIQQPSVARRQIENGPVTLFRAHEALLARYIDEAPVAPSAEADAKQPPDDPAGRSGADRP